MAWKNTRELRTKTSNSCSFQRAWIKKDEKRGMELICDYWVKEKENMERTRAAVRRTRVLCKLKQLNAQKVRRVASEATVSAPAGTSYAYVVHEMRKELVRGHRIQRGRST